MLLLSVSKRGVQSSISQPRSLHPRRGFFFLPRSNRRNGPTHLFPWGWSQKRLAAHPYELLSLLRGTDESQQRTSWGRRWKYEVKNGVVKETSSEFVPGKGWVNTSPIQPEEESQKSSNEAFEETEIDLITLRRVPKKKALEKLDPPQKDPQSPPPAQRSSSEQLQAGGLEGSTKLEPLVKEHSGNPPQGGPQQVDQIETKKAAETAEKGVSESGAPHGQLSSPIVATEKINPETSDARPTAPEDGKPGKERKATPRKDTAQQPKTKTPETEKGQDIPPGIPAADNIELRRSSPSSPPPKHLNQSYLGEATLVDVLDAKLRGLSTTAKMISRYLALRANFKATTVDDAPAKVIDEKTQNLPSKPTEPLGETINTAPKVLAADATKAPEATPPHPSAPVEPCSKIPDIVATSDRVPATDAAGETPSAALSKIEQPRTAAKSLINKSPPKLMEVSEEPATPQAPIPSEEKVFKYHRLNIANRPGETLDSPDADIDLLVPSDIRAAAGSPGKIVPEVESSAEKQKRRKVMVDEFESSGGQQNLSEVPESPEAVRERIRRQAISLGLQSPEPTAENPNDKTSKPVGHGRVETSGAPTLGNAGKLAAGELHEKEDYAWSGTEDVSTEDVLPLGKTKIGPAEPLTLTSTAPKQTIAPVAKSPPPPTHPAQNYYVLVRSPESGHMHFTNLPSTLISEALARENTAFDALQNLDSPGSFLLLWRVLQRGGFTVVGGEKDCLIVKVDADGSKAKQELVLKEIKLQLSPAEVVARESWEKKRPSSETITEPEAANTLVDPDVVSKDLGQNVAATIATAEATTSHPPDTQKSEGVATEERVAEEEIPVVEKVKVQKRRPFRRIFWTAVWVAACSGVVSVGLETYL